MTSTILMMNELGRWLAAHLGRMSVELAILAALVLVVLHALRVKSPALRHAFWSLLLAKPVVTFLVASPLSLYGFLWPPTPPMSGIPLSMPMQIEEPVYELPGPIAPDTAMLPAAAPTPASTPPFWAAMDRYGLISLLWTAAAGVFGLRLLVGWAYIGFLCGTAQTQTGGRFKETLDEAARLLRLRRRVRIATTKAPHGPVLAGILRPVILMPEAMADILSPRQLRLVVTHELAHARRWDNLVLLIQRLAEMFLFFHPVIWFCGWIMRREAEAACDDMVLAAYADADGAAAYADSLTRVAEMKCGITHRLLVNTFAAAESNFTRRIRRILSARYPRATLRFALAVGAVFLLLAAVGLPTASQNSGTAGATESEANSENKASNTYMELMGISAYPPNATSWWNSGGEPLSQAPIKPIESKVTPSPNEKVYQLAFRYLDSRVQCGTTVEFDAAPRRSHTFWEDFCAVTAALPADLTTCSLRINVPLEPWQTVTETHPSPEESGTMLTTETSVMGSVALTPASEYYGSTIITVSYTSAENPQIQLVAIDTAGQEHGNGILSTSGSDKFKQLTAFFSQPLAEVKTIRLETRPYNWVTFKDVPLHPKTQAPKPGEAAAMLNMPSQAEVKNEGDTTFDFAVKKAEDLSGVIYTADGAPAENADVFLATPDNLLWIKQGRVQHRTNAMTTVTDAAGRFHFPPQENNFALSVADDRGYAEVYKEDFEKSKDITLRPWGRVDGVLMIGAKPGAEQWLTLMHDREYDPKASLIHSNDRTTTEMDGHFAFERAIPGLAKVSREIRISNERGAFSHGVPVEVPPGGQVSVTIGGTGRPVTGRLVAPLEYEGEIDWNEVYIGIHTMLSEVPLPDNADGMTGEQKKAWCETWKKSAEVKARNGYCRSYAVAVQDDGYFTVEDMPDGDYKLSVRCRYGEILHEFTVPEMPGGRSDTVLDIGAIPFKNDPAGLMSAWLNS